MSEFALPKINDDDIAWACSVLNLPEHAFVGVDENDPRANALKFPTTLDIEACPGSGKTTLLIAKLAILSRKWEHRRQGICVLSHTNVAKNTLLKKLGNIAEGQLLLAYPHYIGTIHSFVNEFLAIPWLKSSGYRVETIDDHLCEQQRRRLLKRNQFAALRTTVENKEKGTKYNPLGANIVKNWVVSSSDFVVLKKSGDPVFKDNEGRSAKQLKVLVKATATLGYFRHDEMLIWSHDLMDQLPDAIENLRTRFPAVFIDEVQDNTELQSRTLYRIFMEGKNPVIRNRLGDTNQAIFGHSDETEEVKTDEFPQKMATELPNSHRFGNKIAKYANPLGHKPLNPQGLTGQGPTKENITADTEGKHTIFLFDENTIQGVLLAYGNLLLDVFSSEEERKNADFMAVGAVHRVRETKNLPDHISQYWRYYDPAISRLDSKPNTFVQYVLAGQKVAQETNATYPACEKIAEGILRLTQEANPGFISGNRRHRHRQVRELLEDTGDVELIYQEIVRCLAVECESLTPDIWEKIWLPSVKAIAETIGGDGIDLSRTEEFLEWPENLEDSLASAPQDLRTGTNVFSHETGGHQINIRVGSIHSVKGQTHTATLVLDTFSHNQHFEKLLPWLLGEQVGAKKGDGVQNISRLKLHYVAMTRPSHLLCLATRHDILGSHVDALIDIGWQIADVATDGSYKLRSKAGS